MPSRADRIEDDRRRRRPGFRPPFSPVAWCARPCAQPDCGPRWSVYAPPILPAGSSSCGMQPSVPRALTRPRLPANACSTACPRFVPGDTRSPPISASFPGLCPSSAASDPRRRVALSTTRSRSPAWSSARHVCRAGCVLFPRARIPPPASMAPCLRADLRLPAPVFLFPA